MSVDGPQAHADRRQGWLHGHCHQKDYHQKAFATIGAVETVPKLVLDLAVGTIASSCCGMAGPFGYQAETFDVSMKMGEMSLLPAVRLAADNAILGTDGAGRKAVHVARVLERALLED